MGSGRQKCKVGRRWSSLKYRNPNNGMAPLVHEDDMSSDQGAVEIPAFSCRVRLVPRQAAYGSQNNLLVSTGNITTPRTARQPSLLRVASASSPATRSLYYQDELACLQSSQLNQQSHCNGCSSPPDLPPQPEPPSPNSSTLRAEPVPRTQHLLCQPRRSLALQCSCVNMVGSPWLFSASASYEPSTT